jgi:glycosyltransferase involved in cell wall biosynthesis
MPDPFFSIIIPTFNRAVLLPKAIESVLYQTFIYWELIIVDDGSTDNTKGIIVNYNDPRIKYFYQENKERSVARNNGILHSSGTYITFLDSDDYFLPERLENLYTEIKKRNNPVAFFYTGISFEEDGTIVKREEIINNFNSDKDFVVCGVIGTPQACLHSSIFKKHLFNENINISEDMELWLRIVSDGYKLNFIDQYDIVAVKHSGRSVNEFTQNSFYEMAKVLKFMFSKEHPGHYVSSRIKRFVWCGVFYGIARFNIYNRKKWKAIYFLVRSLLIMPENTQTKHKIFLIYKVLFKKKKELIQLKELIG